MVINVLESGVNMPLLKKEIVVLNKLGLHARPAALLVQTTGKFKSEITLSRDNMKVNAKSTMGVMMLAAECDSILNIAVEGEDAEEALLAVEGLFARKFDEE